MCTSELRAGLRAQFSAMAKKKAAAVPQKAVSLLTQIFITSKSKQTDTNDIQMVAENSSAKLPSSVKLADAVLC